MFPLHTVIFYFLFKLRQGMPKDLMINVLGDNGSYNSWKDVVSMHHIAKKYTTLFGRLTRAKETGMTKNTGKKPTSPDKGICDIIAIDVLWNINRKLFRI